MKTTIYNRLAFVATVISLFVASCKDQVPEENPTYATMDKTSDIYFTHREGEFTISDLSDTTLFVPVKRLNCSEEKTYGVISHVTDESGQDVSNIIKVDDHVSFAAGEEKADVKVLIDGIEYGVNYTLEVGIEGVAESEFSTTSCKYNIFCEDPDDWKLVCDTAVFVNNFWSSILSGATVSYENITVKRYADTNRFRIYGLPAIFQYEWQVLFDLGPDTELIKDAEYGIEIDCDKYSEEGARMKKVYMPFQSLGVRLNSLTGTTYNVSDVWAGSVAYNLSSASTGEPMTEGMYPLGTYDTVTGVFKFGNIAVEYQGCDELGINLCHGETALYLDPSKMEIDVRDLQYKNVRRAIFKSKAYLNDDGTFMNQGTKVAVCIDENYEDAGITYRINAPYTASADLYFTHNKANGRVKFLPGQIVGSTALGGYPILCESKTSTYTKTDKEEFYTFNMTFYYINDEGTRFDLGTFKEELELGSEITYYGADDLVRDVPIDDYVGIWQGEFTYIQDFNYTAKFNVTIDKDDDYTLAIRGLSPYMESSYGYDSTLYLEWNDETGVFDLFPQYANTYNSYQINAYSANLDDPNSDLYQDNNLRVGFLENGNIAFVNNPDNKNEVNCIVYYTPASGGALVEPFVPYNIVFERQSDIEAKAIIPNDVRTMIPWSNFRNIGRSSGRSNGHPSFSFCQEVGKYHLLNIKDSGLSR